MIALARSAASLVPGQTACHPADTLHAKDHGSHVHRPGCRRRRAHLGSPVLGRDSHPLREAEVGRRSVLSTPSQMTGEEGTDQVLDFVGLDETPLVVRARKRCRRFAVGAYMLGCSEGVGGNCFVKGCRKCLTVLIVAGIDYRMEVALVNYAGRRAVSECVSWNMRPKANLKKTGLADHSCFETYCIDQHPNLKTMRFEGRSYPVTACYGLDDLDVDLEDLERTGSAVDHKEFAMPESAVHMAVHLSRIGCPGHTAKSQRGLEHYCRLKFHVVPAFVAYAAY